MSTPEPDYLIRLRPLKDSVPAPARLKRFLKMALRGYGLKCVSIEPAVAEPPPVKESDRE